MKRLLLSLIILVSATNTFAHEATSPTEQQRFTGGYGLVNFDNKRFNTLSLAWKAPHKNSLFNLSLGGTKKYHGSSQIISGDVGIDFVDTLSLTFGDAFEISQMKREQEWYMSLGYEWYYSVRSGTWWKMDWDFYPSIGLHGAYHMVIGSSSYTADIGFANEETLSEELKIPTGFRESDFYIGIPTCLNQDIGWVTVRACAMFWTNNKPGLIAGVSFGI